MEEDPMLEGQNRMIKEESFIEKNRLKEYNSNNYLTCTLCFSIIEKVLTKYLFQNSGSHNDFSLNKLSKDLIKDPENKSLFLSFCQMFIEKFGQESPLFLYNQLSKELIRLFKLKDITKIQFDDYILKLEFLLAWHFESNFYPRTSIFSIIESLNDNIYLSNGITNYIYSVESIHTIENFLKIFEKQTICTRIEGDLELVNNLFCTEKVYYFYCDKMNKKKNNEWKFNKLFNTTIKY
jgi:hypothetical protein